MTINEFCQLRDELEVMRVLFDRMVAENQRRNQLLAEAVEQFRQQNRSVRRIAELTEQRNEALDELMAQNAPEPDVDDWWKNGSESPWE